MRRATLFAVLTGLSATLGVAAAFAGSEAPASGELTSLSQLPLEVREAIGPDVADRGGPFAAGCVSRNGEPHSRFASAKIDADKLVVTIERGGIAHFFDAIEFKRVDGHWVEAPRA